MNKTILFGIIAIVALFAAGCVSLGSSQNAVATPQPSVAPVVSTVPAVSDAQVNAVSADVDKALAEMDDVTGELTDINSQDINSSVTG